MKTFLDYIRSNPHRLMSRKHLIGMFAYEPNRPVYPEQPSIDGGIVFAKAPPQDVNKSRYGYFEGETFHELVVSENNPAAPFDPADEITLKGGDIANFKQGTLKTIVGQYLANQILLVESIGDLLPFQNDPWNIRDIEKKLGKLLTDGTITTEHYHKYVENGYELAHFGELFVPTISEKSISVPKAILKRRDELLEKHKDELTDPAVVASIEKELIQMYKDYIGDDPVAGYLEASGKSYNVHAKTMHIMVGGVAPFGGNADDVAVITKSLNEGWDKEQFPAMANSIRKGSYARGVETRDTGALTKNIFRAFQDIRLIDGDCGATKGIEMEFDDTVTPDMFVGRTLLVNGAKVVLTEELVAKYQNKTVTMRSPLTCKQKNGICMTCMGEMFKKLDIRNPGTLAITTTSAMMSASMAAMHVESINVQPIEFEKFLV